MKKKDIAKKMKGEIVSTHKFSPTETMKDMGGNAGFLRSNVMNMGGNTGNKACKKCGKKSRSGKCRECN